VVRPGQDAATLFVALSRLGRCVVPLSAEDAADADRLRVAGVRVVLAPAEDAARHPAPAGVTMLSWQPVLDEVSRLGEMLRLLMGVLLPVRWLVPGRAAREAGLRRPAALVFPRTGPPRLLSHENILSAVDGLQQVLEPDRRRDGILGVLPFTSAYGLVTTLWFPLLSGTRVAWVPEGEVGKLVEQLRLTALPGDPGTLDVLLQRAKSGQLGSLRLVLCGTDPLEPGARTAFADRFGIEPKGAMTSTACAGLVSLNTPDVRSAGHYQQGTREGSVGHPLPRVLLEIVDPVTGAALPRGEPGTVRVRGACLTSRLVDGRVEPPPGFVDLPDRGWLDEHGFLFVVDGDGAQEPT
jgi:acyl-[acyl-carrier-protein]-phospholipid O-acyltransferase/long-chain-fatty-acid--[acyl-carrier-protein] ligase